MYLSLNICTYSECISFEMTTKFQIKYILEEEIDPSTPPPPPKRNLSVTMVPKAFP